MEVFKKCAGVILYNKKKNSIILANRFDGQGWSFLGGKQDEGESITETAVRETFEESGVKIITSDLNYIGVAPGFACIKQKKSLVMSTIYCVFVEDVELNKNNEMAEFKEVCLDDLDFFIENYRLFSPTKSALVLFIDYLNNLK